MSQSHSRPAFSRAAIRHGAERWVLPGVIAAMVLGNQPFVVAKLMGQALGWVNLVAAAVIVYEGARHKGLVMSLLFAVVATKLLRLTGAVQSAETMYISTVSVLFCVAGAMVAVRRGVMLYRQVMVIALLNVVFMLLQVVGVGAWTQLLTTHGEGNLTVPVRTLFVSAEHLEYQLVQGRPAGLSYSNIVLALLIVFATVLHLSMRRTDPARFRWGSAVVCLMVILSMSKFVLIAGPLIALWFVISRRGDDRKAAVRALGGIVLGVMAYCVVFPGLAATNLSATTIATSFLLRINDVVGGLPGTSGLTLLTTLKEQAEVKLKGTPRASWVAPGAFVSGYAQIVAVVPQVLPVLFFAALAYPFVFRAMRRHCPALAERAAIVACLIALYPFTFPPWGLQLYWFIAGVGFLPFFYVARAAFLRAESEDRQNPTLY